MDNEIKKQDKTKMVYGSLLGLSFTLTGKYLCMTREKMEALITTNKGQLHPTITKRTDFLVTGEFLEDGRKTTIGKKYLKAQSLGTPIFAEEDFQRFLKGRFRNPEYLLGNKDSYVKK